MQTSDEEGSTEREREVETYTAIRCAVDSRLGVSPDICLDHIWWKCQWLGAGQISPAVGSKLKVLRVEQNVSGLMDYQEAAGN